MESNVGYSQGTGTKIATHEVDQGGDQVHHQRFAPGAGAIFMDEIIAYEAVGIAESALIDCKGSGRIVIAINQTLDGSIFKIHFYDKNLMDLGSSDEITPVKSGRLAYLEASSAAWIASTLYEKGTLKKVAGTGHIYMQTVEGGISDTPTEPVWPVDGSTIVDGTCVWHDLGLYGSVETTPLIIYSNSFGAAFFKLELTSLTGAIVAFGGAL